MENEISTTRIRGLSKKELSELYQVSPKTFRKWINTPNRLSALKKLGYNPSDRMFTPRQVEYIFDVIGVP